MPVRLVDETETLLCTFDLQIPKTARSDELHRLWEDTIRNKAREYNVELAITNGILEKKLSDYLHNIASYVYMGMDQSSEVLDIPIKAKQKVPVHKIPIVPQKEAVSDENEKGTIKPLPSHIPRYSPPHISPERFSAKSESIKLPFLLLMISGIVSIIIGSSIIVVGLLSSNENTTIIGAVVDIVGFILSLISPLVNKFTSSQSTQIFQVDFKPVMTQNVSPSQSVVDHSTHDAKVESKTMQTVDSVQNKPNQ